MLPKAGLSRRTNCGSSRPPDFQPINTVPNVFLNDGSQGVDDNYIRNALVRLTYQVSPRHKIVFHYERVFGGVATT
jgi:hypothetical protein